MSDFNKFLADISSVYWWIAVVLVGLVINLASAYLKPVLDNFYLKHSASRKRKIDVENKKLDTEAGILLKDMHLLILKGFEEVRWFVLSIFLLLLAFVIAYLSSRVSGPTGPQPLVSALLFFLAFSIFMLALWAFQRASDITLVLLKTRRKKLAQLAARREGISTASMTQDASEEEAT